MSAYMNTLLPPYPKFLFQFSILFFVILVITNPYAPWVTGAPPFVDNDDFMRMVKVLDLVDQKAPDSYTVPRLGPEGAEVPWSRLIDWSLAGIFIIFNTVLDRDMAIMATVYTYSAIMLNMFLYAAYFCSHALLKDREQALSVVGIILISVAATLHFMAGRIDHHMVQMIILLWAYGCTIRLWYDRKALVFAMMGGAFLGFGLIIGTDILPWIVLLHGLLGLFWLARGREYLKLAFIYSLSCSMVAAVGHIFLYNEGDFFSPHCDALGIPFLIMSAAPLFVWSFLYMVDVALPMRENLLIKVFAGSISAGIGGMTLYALIPHCIHDPYQMEDGYAREIWLNYVTEAQSIIDTDLSWGPLIFCVFLSVLTGLLGALSGVLTYSGQERKLWIFILLISILSVGLLFVQVRTTAFIQTLMLAPGAYSFVMLSHLFKKFIFYLRTLSKKQQSLLLYGFFLLLLGIPGGLLTYSRVKSQEIRIDEVDQTDPGYICNVKNLSRYLNTLSTTHLISVSTDYGAPILFYTPHRVMAAPYHRNSIGIGDNYRVLLAKSPEDAKKIIQKDGISMILVCPSESAYFKTVFHIEGAFFTNELDEGNIPGWLEPLKIPDDVDFKVFAVNQDVLLKNQ